MNVEQDGEMVNNQQGETNTQHEMDSDEEMSDKLELKLPKPIRDLPVSEDDAVGYKFSVAKVDKAIQTDPALSATPTLEGAPHSLTCGTHTHHHHTLNPSHTPTLHPSQVSPNTNSPGHPLNDAKHCLQTTTHSWKSNKNVCPPKSLYPPN